jgi:transposase
VGDAAVPEPARAACRALLAQIAALGERVLALEAELRRRHATSPASRRLAEIPGIGLLGAAALATGTEPGHFRTARDYAAALGLVPQQTSTGGRERLGAISRMGDGRARSLLVEGASAVLKRLPPRHGAPGAAPAATALGAWALLRLLEYKPWRLVAVALANKVARIAWAVLTRGEDYRPGGGAAAAPAAA